MKLNIIIMINEIHVAVTFLVRICGSSLLVEIISSNFKYSSVNLDL
jgi:hypothetical protein